MKIGIVAIQGDYEAHAKTLDRLGVAHQFVLRPEDLAGVSGVILPGGESSTHLKVMTEEGLFDALKKFARDGGAFLGLARARFCWRAKCMVPRSNRSGCWI